MRILSVALYLLLFIAPSFADGGAIVRPATPAEKAFIQSSKRSLKMAIGKVPSGWELSSESSEGADDLLRFAGIQEYPIDSEYRATMKLMEGMEQRRQAHDLVEQETAPAFNRIRELSNIVQNKNFEASQAMQSGDRQAYEKAKAELEAADKESQALLEGTDSPAKKMAAADLALAKDTEIKVNGITNSLFSRINGALSPLQVPGAKAAVRVDYSDPRKPSRALILLGDWTIEKFGEGSNQSLVARRAPAKEDKLTKVYSIALNVECDRDRLDNLVSSLDISSLQSLF